MIAWLRQNRRLTIARPRSISFVQPTPNTTKLSPIDTFDVELLKDLPDIGACVLQWIERGQRSNTLIVAYELCNTNGLAALLPRAFQGVER